MELIDKNSVVTNFISFLVIVLLGSGCTAITVPEIEYISLSDGDIFYTRDVTIEWEGMHHHRTDTHWRISDNLNYYYKIDNSPWEKTQDTQITLTELTEGLHTFYINAEYEEEAPGLTINKIFIVDAIKGPGIVFSPRKVTSNSVIVIGFEDVQTIMSAHIEIVCESGCANLNNFIKKESLEDSGGYITLSNDDDPERLVIDIAFTGYTDGINGSPVLGSFIVNPLHSGKISVDFEKTRFKNTENIDITFEPTSLDWVVVNK